MAAITFAGGTLDRASDRRADEQWARAAREDPRARAVVASARGVLLDGPPPQPGADAWEAGSGEPLSPRLVALDDRDPILLGVLPDGTPLWTIEADGSEALTGLRE